MADLPQTFNLKAYMGDSWSKTFLLWTDGAPTDLTGATVAAWARTCGNGAAPTYLVLQVTLGVDPGTVVLAPPAGGFTKPEMLTYDLEVTMPDGTITTWVRGRLQVDQDVTNTAGVTP
jgi:hypothetical protein